MGSFRIFRRQTVNSLMVFGLLAATIVSGFLPALAWADQVTERSIALSSSSKGATNVTYEINFKSVSAGGAFAVFFCSNTPLLGDTCDAPSGFSVSAATSATSGFTDVTAPSANQLVVAGTIGAATPISVDVDNIDNPTAAGPLYARIVTFDSKANATSASASSETNTGAVDNGGVAMSITDSVSVSGKVLESMTFCVSGPSTVDNTNPLGAGCINATTPSLLLGETVGTVKALSSGAVSTGDVYTQISTNAIGGAVVYIKSDNVCGGLARFNVTTCDIAPAQKTDITQGQAKVGVLVAADSATDTTLNATGTFEAVAGSGYNATTYALNYVSGGASGVTSVYGDPILDTGATGSETQPSNKNMKLTFGASIAGNTPAGNYSNSYSLVATGKF